jgi:hypothetical protein
LEERRLELEEKVMMELIADKNRTMVMEPSIMDAFTREWWDMRREGILERRRQARFHASASGGGGRASESDGGAGGDEVRTATVTLFGLGVHGVVVFFCVCHI